MPEINPLTNNQIFLKKIAENTGSDYETGDVSEINPLTIDQIFLKEIAANTAGQSGDIEKVEDMISDAYDSTHTYNVGDYCIYENALYKCNTASTTGTWDSSKWDAVTVAHEVKELTDGLKWKYLMTIGDNDTHSLGITFKELYAVGNFGSISVLLLPNESAARSGFYRASDDNGDMYIIYINGELTVNAYFINGVNKVSSGVKIYYR